MFILNKRILITIKILKDYENLEMIVNYNKFYLYPNNFVITIFWIRMKDTVPLSSRCTPYWYSTYDIVVGGVTITDDKEGSFIVIGNHRYTKTIQSVPWPPPHGTRFKIRVGMMWSTRTYRTRLENRRNLKYQTPVLFHCNESIINRGKIEIGSFKGTRVRREVPEDKTKWTQ